MKRLFPWALAVAGVGAAIVLFLLLQRPDPADTSATQPGAVTAPGAAATPGAVTHDPGASAGQAGAPLGQQPATPGSGTAGTAPGMAQGSTAASGHQQIPPATQPGDPGQAETQVRVYTAYDGTMVRDHRPGDQPLIPRPARRPGEPRVVDAQTIVAVRNAMRPIVKKCFAAVDAASVGAKPLLQSMVVVSVATGQLVVDDAVVQPVDVADAQVAGLRQCIESQLVTVKLSAPGQADVSRYALNLPFELTR